MHLEMAASLPAAEACDDQVATESPARSAIKSMLAIFMFPLRCSLVCETRCHLYLKRSVGSYVFSLLSG
jgi:hypothetical protein